MRERIKLGRRWKRQDYSTTAIILARLLLGRVLVRTLDDGTILAGRIVETEAYCGETDAASHAFRGRRTPRNEAMYAAPGAAYVYFTYGMHFCMNVVCGRENQPLAVLLRALEPLAGADVMRRLRSAGSRLGARSLPDRLLCSGPARLCQALAIDRSLNHENLVSSRRLFITEPAMAPRSRRIVRTPRIGIGYAGEWANKPLRFLLQDSEHVSVRTPTGRARPKPPRRNGQPGRLRPMGV